MTCGNFSFLKSPSGIFRLSTVVTGIPAVVLAWIAYFSSSWTDVFPEILAILAVEKSAHFNLDAEIRSTNASTNLNSSSSSSSGPYSSSTRPGQGDDDDYEYDIISDSEEDYLDAILLQTMVYEKFFIGVVSVVFVISAAYLILRVMAKHQPDSTYEIMFDFIFHVLCALGLLTGSGLVLLSAAKIQNFVDQVSERDGFTHPEIINIIERNKDTVQDKADKIAAAVIAMLNGVLYALCVVTIRMTDPLKCERRRRKKARRQNMKVVFPHLQPQHPYYNDAPVFSVMPFEQQSQNDLANGSYGFYRNSNNNSYTYD